MLEGTVISSVEEKADDRARMACSSGASCMIGGYSVDERKTRVHLFTGSRKTLKSTCRVILGIAAYTS